MATQKKVSYTVTLSAESWKLIVVALELNHNRSSNDETNNHIERLVNYLRKELDIPYIK